jgi:hypothetical protein
VDDELGQVVVHLRRLEPRAVDDEGAAERHLKALLEADHLTAGARPEDLLNEDAVERRVDSLGVDERDR